MIRSVNTSQEEILQNIIDLYLGGRDIECDPTYSKGVFYKGKINRPTLTFDLKPIDSGVIQADCRKLPVKDSTIESICFDPPFVISSGPSLDNPKEGSNIISKRFACFKSPKEMYTMYSDSLKEFYRVLRDKGFLIFKCQDTVSSGKQYLSSWFIIDRASKIGFYPRDVFVLVAKSRLIGRINKQYHARKFHSYFLVLEKKKINIDYGC